ncbi:MAG TPA: DUF5915 domain-containing protein, partial [Bacteroidota bacterium]
KLAAPFVPFLSDELFRNLSTEHQRATEPSVHLTMLPEVHKELIDRALEQRMEYAMKVVELVRAMRMKSNLKTRQPLSRIIIPVLSEDHKNSISQMEEVILEETNVKKIEFVSDESGVVKKKAKPNFKTLGKKYGKEVQVVAAGIRELAIADIRRLQKEGTFMLSASGRAFEISVEDVEILHEDIRGWLVESDGSLTVALDTELNESLVNEGLAREFVSKVQNLRKESGFEVTDRISIHHRSSEKLSNALEQMSEYVKQETLAREIKRSMAGDKSILIFNSADINGEQCEIAVEKI